MAVAASRYAEHVQAAFGQATAAIGVDERSHRLAGRVVRMRFAGRELARRLGAAFAHLDAAPADADAALTIAAWDRRATGVAPPAPPWAVEDYGPRERIRGAGDAGLRASYDVGHGVLSLSEPGRGLGAFHAVDAALLPRWLVRMPFRHLLGWWAGDRGLTFVHAAAVGTGGACLLLPGASGSGKSTTALAASEHGLDFLADDLCLVDVAARRAHAAFCWAKAEADALGRIPSLADRVSSTEAGQSLLRPANLVNEAAVAGLAIPRVTSRANTTWRPAAARDAMFALAPSTMIEGNGAGPESLRMLAELARAVPAFHLELGTDMAGVAGALDELVGACR